jgi:hypothetical protein
LVFFFMVWDIPFSSGKGYAAKAPRQALRSQSPEGDEQFRAFAPRFVREGTVRGSAETGV